MREIEHSIPAFVPANAVPTHYVEWDGQSRPFPCYSVHQARVVQGTNERAGHRNVRVTPVQGGGQS